MRALEAGECPMPEVIDMREKMANQLLMRGHASMRELLTASFGEWPPRGLEINPNLSHDQQVTFKPFLDATKDQRMGKNIFSKLWNILGEEMDTLGRGTISGDRLIWINKFKLCTLPRILGGGGSINSTMGHETIHILQGDHYWRAQEVFGAEIAQDIWTGHNNAASNMIMHKLTESGPKPPKSAWQKSSLMKAFNAVASWVRDDKRHAYLKEGIEVQARIHQIIMDGYSRWGRMPQTHGELIAALTNAGLKPPPEIAQYLSNLTEDSSVRRFLPREKGYTGAAVDIQSVSSSFSRIGQWDFWQETLPAIYADLIEMYGDIPGRARFGLGVNPKSEFRQMSAPKSGITPSPA